MTRKTKLDRDNEMLAEIDGANLALSPEMELNVSYCQPKEVRAFWRGHERAKAKQRKRKK